MFLDRDKPDEAHRLAEALSHYMEDQCNKLAEESEARALLYWYSNGGTPILARKSTYHKLGNHQVVRLLGMCEEHLVQWAIAKTTERSGSPLSWVVMAPPHPLTEGMQTGN